MGNRLPGVAGVDTAVAEGGLLVAPAVVASPIVGRAVGDSPLVGMGVTNGMFVAVSVGAEGLAPAPHALKSSITLSAITYCATCAVVFM